MARFVPIGRVAVNLTAGATHFPRSRFVALTVLSAVLWAAYSVAIGLFFGQWFEENHLLGVIVAVICAIGPGHPGGPRHQQAARARFPRTPDSRSLPRSPKSTEP